MTQKLTSKELEFVNQMTQSIDKAAWGFGLLLKRLPNKLDRYFDQLNGKGLFDARHNSGPIPAKEEGFVHIPYWPALDYLEAVAKIAGDCNDGELANKIMTIVRTISNMKVRMQRIDNFHTSRLFAKIIGLVPCQPLSRKISTLFRSGWIVNMTEAQ